MKKHEKQTVGRVDKVEQDTYQGARFSREKIYWNMGKGEIPEPMKLHHKIIKRKGGWGEKRTETDVS